MSWKRSKICNLFKALILRVIIIIHGVFLYDQIISPSCTNWLIFALMTFGVILILGEGVYNLGWRLGHEWKWYVFFKFESSNDRINSLLVILFFNQGLTTVVDLHLIHLFAITYVVRRRTLSWKLSQYEQN